MMFVENMAAPNKNNIKYSKQHQPHSKQYQIATEQQTTIIITIIVSYRLKRAVAGFSSVGSQTLCLDELAERYDSGRSQAPLACL